MTHISENWANTVDPVIRHVFDTSLMGMTKDWVSRLYRVETSDRSIERSLGVGGFSDLQAHNGEAQELLSYEQYLQTYTHSEYSGLITIEKKWLEDDLTGTAKSRAEGAAGAWFRTRQKHAASIFEEAFTTTRGADSLALCASAHTSKTPGVAVQSNTGTATLTSANIVAGQNNMNVYKDDQGELMSSNGTLVLAGNAQRETLSKILKSVHVHGSANYDPSIGRETFDGDDLKGVIWNRITGNKWFLIDEQMMKTMLRWYDRVKKEIVRDVAFKQRAAQWMVYGRWSYGFDDWRWIYGNNPG